MRYIWTVKLSDKAEDIIQGQAYTLCQAHAQAMAKCREMERLARSSWEQVRIIEMEWGD